MTQEQVPEPRKVGESTPGSWARYVGLAGRGLLFAAGVWAAFLTARWYLAEPNSVRVLVDGPPVVTLDDVREELQRQR